MKKLVKLSGYQGVKGPVVTIVMDGVGLAPARPGNAVADASTPTLDMLMKDYPWVSLKAHGTAVGLPSDDDMGNSEVGHNALGAGQVFAQGAKLVSNSIASGKMFESETWKNLIANVRDNHTVLHFLGLFSDGNVHSHIDHLKAMIKEAKKEGLQPSACIFCLTDATSAKPPAWIISFRLKRFLRSSTTRRLTQRSHPAADV